MTGSLIFTLGLLEVVARLLHLGSGGFWEPSPLYGWQNIPNARGWESCYGECDTYVEINSRGLRDYEIPYEKPAGVQRLLFLGDSMTAGLQVPLEQTFVKILEANLQPAGDFETINAGTNAFGTDNELIFYRLEGVKYQADIVVLSMYLANDIYNNHHDLETRISGSGHKPYFLFDENGELALQNFPVDGLDTFGIRFGTFLKRYFQLPRFLAQTLHLRANVPEALRPLVELAGGQRGGESDQDGTGGAAGRGVNICAAQYDPIIVEAWDLTKAIILQLREEVAEHGARLVVLIIPASPQIVPPAEGEEWYCNRPDAEMAAFLEAEAIPSLDLLQAFRDHSLAGGEPLYFERDFHMNPAGHALAGDLLSRFFLEQLEIGGQTNGG